MKKMIILGMVLTSLLTGCGMNNVEEDYVEESVNNEYFASKEAEFVHNFYPAVECIIGKEVRLQDVEYVEDGFMIDDVLVSYDLIDTHCAYCHEDSCQ